MKIKLDYLLYFLLSILLILGCSPSDKFSKNLSREVSKGNGAKVSFQDLTDFSWDKVYVYGPYSPMEVINNKHRANLSNDLSSVPENQCLYVFTQDNNVIETSFHERVKGSCVEILEPGIYNPSTANFVVQIRTKGAHPILTQKKL